jgi:hypothetical protein
MVAAHYWIFRQLHRDAEHVVETVRTIIVAAWETQQPLVADSIFIAEARGAIQLLASLARLLRRTKVRSLLILIWRRRCSHVRRVKLYPECKPDRSSTLFLLSAEFCSIVHFPCSVLCWVVEIIRLIRRSTQACPWEKPTM